MPNLKEQITYLEVECKQNEQAFSYIKREFGEKGAELLGDRFLYNIRLFKDILASLRELQGLKLPKQL
jgi:hypothetical protein